MDDGKSESRGAESLLFAGYLEHCYGEGFLLHSSSHCGSGSPYVTERDINSDLSSLQSKDAPDLQQRHPGTQLQVLVTVFFIGGF